MWWVCVFTCHILAPSPSSLAAHIQLPEALMSLIDVT